MTANPWFPRIFVGAVWLLMTLSLLAYVAHYGSNVPFLDDWHLVPVIAGDQPVTAEWLWSQHGDHRVPLSRLLLLGLGKLYGYDFRCGMVFNVLALSGASLVLIFLSQRLRGHLSWTDAFFPLVLLNPGQWEIYLWCWLVSLTLPIALAFMELAIMAWWGVRPSLWATLAAGVLLLLLPLTDPAGLAFVPAIVLWLATCGIVAWRERTSSTWTQRVLPLLFACAAIGLVAVYFVGYRRLQGGEGTPSMAAVLRTTIEILSMSIGHASVLIWPWSVPIVLGLLTAGVYALRRTWTDQPQDRSRVAGLLFFWAGAFCLVLALGWGRGGEGGSAGFKSRYVVMVVPVICTIFLSCNLYRNRLRTVVQAAMCLLMMLLLPLNIKTAIDSANNFRPYMAAFEEDLRNGKPASLLAERHTNFLQPMPAGTPDGQYLEAKPFVHERLLMLQRGGIGPYRDMAPDVPLREVDVAYDPSKPIRLEKPQNVLAIRIRYAFDKDKKTGLRVAYKEPEQNSFDDAEVVHVPPVFGVPPEKEQTDLAYVNRRIDQIWIGPAAKAHLISIIEVVLLVENR